MGLGAVHTQGQGGTWRVIVSYISRSLTEWRGDTVRWRKRAWLWFGPMSDSTFINSKEAKLSWKQITNP